MAFAAPASAWEMRICADPDYLPFSNRALEGYENKIAAIIAEELDAEPSYLWWPQAPTMITEQLREGHCDLIMGVPDSQNGLLPTIAYYQSPYVFVYRSDSDYDITGFDDEVLADLRLGVQATTDPPHGALAKRGLAENVIIQYVARPEDPDGPFAPLVKAVAAGEIDVAVPWGPVGGYYAARQDRALTVTPAPTFDLPFTPMYISVVMAVRRGDEALRDRLNVAIARRWDDIAALLEDYNVPLLPLPRPQPSRIGP